jgi:RimJ/RimL family protein N-acetyltransferase
MKPCVIGKTIFLREVSIEDAEFIVKLRTDPAKSKFISETSANLSRQIDFLNKYRLSETDFYFIICNHDGSAIGTIRIYDVRGESFCWGSWMLISNAPRNAAIESALLVYEYAFFALHYKRAHFDVRKDNESVVGFHKRFGAQVVNEDHLNYYFNFEFDTYLQTRNKYCRYLP